MISSRLPDRFLRFHSSKCTVAASRMEMVVTGTIALGKMVDSGERKENCRFSEVAA